MRVAVFCPKCQKSLSVVGDLGGRSARCPVCGGSVQAAPAAGGALRSTVGPADAPSQANSGSTATPEWLADAVAASDSHAGSMPAAKPEGGTCSTDVPATIGLYQVRKV